MFLTATPKQNCLGLRCGVESLMSLRAPGSGTGAQGFGCWFRA